MRFIIILSIFLLPVSTACAVDTSTLPILRIEAGDHIATLRSIATDGKGRFVATVSDDKTARLFETSTGRLVRILRPPIGAGYEGSIYAVAVSPDGATLAIGGWTRLGSDSGYTIYILDTSSGMLVRRITNLSGVINSLAFSMDGGILAASLGGNSGIRLFRTKDGSELGRDIEYFGGSHSVHFSADGRLVSSSLDGGIRLYEGADGKKPLRLIVKKYIRDGGQPFSARFSPDGTRIAVGYYNNTKVDVLNSYDLSLLLNADTTGINNGNLSSVAWSTDGRTLFAGGKYIKQFEGVWQYPVRSWHLGESGKGENFPLSLTSPIVSLASLPDNSLLAGTHNPALVMLGQNRQSHIWAQSPIAYYKGGYENFQISADGDVISFGYQEWGKSPYSFSLTDKKLSPAGEGRSDLYSPITALTGITIDRWRENTSPGLNGIPLKLNPHEKSYSLALSSDGSRFLIGTEWNLRCFSISGDQTWEKQAPGKVWSVNISQSGRIAVAAYGDGTIRWHRMSDGKELLSFFPHADRKRWVLWTPEGFFCHSPGGDDLIGWHINRGDENMAEFVPVSRLHKQFYRPDLVDAAFNGKDLAEISKEIDISKILATDNLPPTVRLLTRSGRSNARNTKIRAEICDNGGGIGNITLYINNTPAPLPKNVIGLKTPAKSHKSCGTFEHDITLANGDNEISLVAYNKNSTIESNRNSIRLGYASGKKARP